MSNPVESFYIDGRWPLVNCPSGYTGSQAQDGPRGSRTRCTFTGFPPAPPPAPAPAPVYNNYNTSTVSPNVTVSPQVSPVFQQQFQPNNSPASAGTAQTSGAGLTQADVDRLLNERIAQYEQSRAYVPPTPVNPVLTNPTSSQNQNPIESQGNSTQNNTPPPITGAVNLPPASGSGASIPFESGIPDLESLLPNNTQTTIGSSVAPANNKSTLYIGAGLALLALLLLGNKKQARKK